MQVRRNTFAPPPSPSLPLALPPPLHDLDMCRHGKAIHILNWLKL